MKFAEQNTTPIELRRQSGFDALRLLAAVGVLWSHVYAVRGDPLSEPLLQWSGGLINGGMLSVNTFFAISGYLVTKSFSERVDRVGDWGAFIAARALRIFPALLVCLLVTVIAGAVLSGLGAMRYWSSAGVYNYVLLNFVLVHQNLLPDVFEGNPGGAGVNGSLWTLRLEVGMYVATALLGCVGAWRKRSQSLLWVTVLITWCAIAPGTFIFYPHGNEFWVLNSVLCYAIGALLWVYGAPQAALVVAGSVVFAILVVIAIWMDGMSSNGPRLAASALIAIIAVAVGRLSAAPFEWITRGGDLSYGVFLYSAPVQQTIVFLQPEANVGQVFTWSLLITMLFAACSWHCVEHPLLNLKGRFARHSGSSNA